MRTSFYKLFFVYCYWFFHQKQSDSLKHHWKIRICSFAIDCWISLDTNDPVFLHSWSMSHMLGNSVYLSWVGQEFTYLPTLFKLQFLSNIFQSSHFLRRPQKLTKYSPSIWQYVVSVKRALIRKYLGCSISFFDWSQHAGNNLISNSTKMLENWPFQ